MTTYTTIKTARDTRGVVTVSLARPQVHNAMILETAVDRLFSAGSARGH